MLRRSCLGLRGCHYRTANGCPRLWQRESARSTGVGSLANTRLDGCIMLSHTISCMYVAVDISAATEIRLQSIAELNTEMIENPSSKWTYLTGSLPRPTSKDCHRRCLSSLSGATIQPVIVDRTGPASLLPFKSTLLEERGICRGSSAASGHLLRSQK